MLLLGRGVLAHHGRLRVGRRRGQCRCGLKLGRGFAHGTDRIAHRPVRNTPGR